MSINKFNLLYIVEGQTEQAFIDAIKGEFIEAGRVTVRNPATKRLSENILRLIKKPTVCILVFDKDVYNENKANESIVLNNIRFLNRDKNIKKVIAISQENDLDDEIVRSTTIKTITKLLNSKSKKNSKSDIIKCNNLLSKLKANNFDIDHFWIKRNLHFLPVNESALIKLKK